MHLRILLDCWMKCMHSWDGLFGGIWFLRLVSVLILAINCKPASHRLWGSASLKMPIHAHFFQRAILTSKVGHTDPNMFTGHRYCQYYLWPYFGHVLIVNVTWPYAWWSSLLANETSLVWYSFFASGCVYEHICCSQFNLVNTHKHTDPVFGVWSAFICRSVRARLQVSVRVGVRVIKHLYSALLWDEPIA